MAGLRSWLVLLFVSFAMYPISLLVFGLEAAMGGSLFLPTVIGFLVGVIWLGFVFPRVVRFVFNVDVVPQRKRRNHE